MRDREEEARKAFAWDWSAETWSWSPEQGRWSPAFGRPREPVYLTVSTAALPAAVAYDFWRESVFYYFDAERPPAPVRGFRGRAEALIGEQVEFYCYESDPVAGARPLKQIRADGGDDIDLGFVLAGSRAHEQEGDRALRTGPGMLFLYDSARPSQVAWDRHHGAHLSLRRQAVERALGGRVMPPSLLAAALSASPLAPLLRDQFSLLAAHMGRLPPAGRGFLFEQTANLALFALERLGQNGDTPAAEEDSAGQAGLFAAAQRYIDRNLTHPALGSAAIAQALGCSRATLYRAFRRQGLAVQGFIRDRRLEQFLQALQSAPAQVPIHRLAERCGLYDTPNVGQMFRRRFGMSPSEARALAAVRRRH